jgi:hypothetical protein
MPCQRRGTTTLGALFEQQGARTGAAMLLNTLDGLLPKRRS